MARPAGFDLNAAIERADLAPEGSASRILRCAEQLFAARGFDGVTTRDVSMAAGVNVATLHFHWSDKRTLYEAVCRRQAQQILRFIENAEREPENPAPSLAERAEDWVDASLDLLFENPAIARLAWQSVSGQNLPELPTLLQHDVGVFRALQSRIRKTPGAPNASDAALILLALFYFSVGVFSDSAIQRAVLGGSVYERPALRRRVKRFVRRLVRLLLDEPSDSGEAR